jgi:hypothetical protein
VVDIPLRLLLKIDKKSVASFHKNYWGFTKKFHEPHWQAGVRGAQAHQFAYSRSRCRLGRLCETSMTGGGPETLSGYEIAHFSATINIHLSNNIHCRL